MNLSLNIWTKLCNGGGGASLTGSGWFTTRASGIDSLAGSMLGGQYQQ
ncbi:29570_t:CDS:2 [Gigaspora margarita]|uniref:29570_t:CDS:1 n=1 Tax=Gigaspora margarita TaxID=4874 RepID=A0ABN7WYJ6_GIGMA|nr:29570_t:CDS:2 [Gigaspora margarita]